MFKSNNTMTYQNGPTLQNELLVLPPIANKQ